MKRSTCALSAVLAMAAGVSISCRRDVAGLPEGVAGVTGGVTGAAGRRGSGGTGGSGVIVAPPDMALDAPAFDADGATDAAAAPDLTDDQGRPALDAIGDALVDGAGETAGVVDARKDGTDAIPPGAGCGSPLQRCCGTSCVESAVCIPAGPGASVCIGCGARGDYCCAGGACAAGLSCHGYEIYGVQGRCQPCGIVSQPCCAGRCAVGLRCSGDAGGGICVR